MIIPFCENLDVKKFIDFSTDTNEIIVMGLWKYSKNKRGQISIFEKDENANWVKKDFTNCSIMLNIEKGMISMAMSNNYLCDLSIFESKIAQWFDGFYTAVANTIRQLYFVKYARKLSKASELKLLNYIKQSISGSNFEDKLIFVSRLHTWFNDAIPSENAKKVVAQLNGAVQLGNVINLGKHTVAFDTFNEFLPNHFAIFAVLNAEIFIEKVQRISFSDTKEFTAFILDLISEEVCFSNYDIKFFMNLDVKSISLFVSERSVEKFCMWLKLFSSSAHSINFTNIDLLYKTFMHIGRKECTKNTSYMTRLFLHFQQQHYQNNHHDLMLAIKYSVIDNCIDWRIKNQSSPEELANDLSNAIYDIRKVEIIQSFVRLSDMGINRLSKSSEMDDAKKSLWENCVLFIGEELGCDESNALSFSVYRDGEYSILIGAAFVNSVSIFSDFLVEGDGGFKNYHYLDKYAKKVMYG